MHLGARCPLTFHKGLLQSLYLVSPLPESDWCRLEVQIPRWHLARGDCLTSLPSTSTCRARIAPESTLQLGARSPPTFHKGLFCILYLDSPVSESDKCMLEAKIPRWHLARGHCLASLPSSSTCRARIAPESTLHLGARSPLTFHKGLFQSLYLDSPLSESDWCRLEVQSPRWHLARGGSLSPLPSSSTCRARIAPE